MIPANDNRSDERHLIVEFTCSAEHAERVEGLLHEYVGPARLEDGCLYYHVFRHEDAVGRFFVLDGWRDAKALAAHRGHPNVLRVRAALLPLLAEAPRLTIIHRLSGDAQ